MSLPPTSTDRARALVAYSVAAIASMVILTAIYKLWRADFQTPFSGAGDAAFLLTMAKAAVENGWYVENPNLGAPDGLELYDFPSSDSLHFLSLKLLAKVTPGYVAAFNVYFLLGFPLTTITTLFVLRRFQVSYVPAIVASLLYAFQPFHYFRGLGHLTLSQYFFVPCSVLVSLWIFLDRLPIPEGVRQTQSPERKPRLLRLAGSVLICLMQSSTHVYLAFFACYLFIVAGVAAALHRKRCYPLYTVALLVGVTAAGVFANIGSHFLYERSHGPNREAALRSPLEAELYGMKITHLLFPIPGHRLGILAKKRDTYDRLSVPTNENTHAALGAVGSLGFCVLVGLLLVTPSESEESKLLRALSLLNVFAVLLATIGGFGMIFNSFVTPQIRSYNRLSIFIAFYALFAVALLVQKFGERFAVSSGKRFLWVCLMLALLCAGLFDQTPQDVAWDYTAGQRAWKNDGELVERIEQILPPQALIYQMPYVPFPEWPPVFDMHDYDHFHGYLHSRQLRWSYGSMKGRPAADRAEELSLRPIAEQLPELVKLGFRGIWVDRFGYEDHGGRVETELSELLRCKPLTSGDERLAFFDMTDYVARLPSP